jgi:hypothetical protein
MTENTILKQKDSNSIRVLNAAEGDSKTFDFLLPVRLLGD